MKVVVLSPCRVVLAGAISAILIAGSILGVLALAGVFDGDVAEAYGASGMGAKRWYFAEGYTGPGFEEWILIYNPPAHIGGSGMMISPVIDMYGPGGSIGYITGISVAPGQRPRSSVKKHKASSL